MTFGHYASLMAVWAVGVASPGPDAVLVLRHSAHGSRRAGVAAALGIASGIAVWVTLAMIGLEAALASNPALVGGLQVAGGLLLGYLGVAALRSPGGLETSPSAAPALGRPFMLGLATNITNPKALVFFAAVFATLIPHTATVGDWATVAVLLVLAEAAWFTTLAIFASSRATQKWFRTRWFAVVTGVAFLGLGAVVLVAGMTAFG